MRPRLPLFWAPRCGTTSLRSSIPRSTWRLRFRRVFFPSYHGNGYPWPGTIPKACGRPICIEFRQTVPDAEGGPAHAATYLRRRQMVLEEALMADTDNFARV